MEIYNLHITGNVGNVSSSMGSLDSEQAWTLREVNGNMNSKYVCISCVAMKIAFIKLSLMSYICACLIVFVIVYMHAGQVL